MRDDIKSNNGENYKLIHKTIKRIAKIIGRTNFDLEVDSLAREVGIKESKFIQLFQTKENFLQLTINRMLQLFSEIVARPVAAQPLKNKDNVFYFLRCVEEYLSTYPEAGYLFTMTFFGDIATSDLYYSLEQYYNVWEKTLYECLSAIMSSVLAKRLTDIYLISLKGQLQLADYELIPRNSYHAENFLTQALFNLH